MRTVRNTPDSTSGGAARDGHDLVALMFREISDLLVRRPSHLARGLLYQAGSR